MRCAACFLQAHGLAKPLAKMASCLSPLTQPLALLPGLSNAARTVLQASPLMKRRIEATREWWRGMAKVIALREWT